MKKVLLGSTAFLSAALLSHGALAQTAPAAAPSTADQPVKLGISGYLQGGYLANLHETANQPGGTNSGIGTGFNRNTDAVQQYGLLDFSGDTKFSNGLGAGVFIELYAMTHTSGAGQIKNDWVHITGDSFGEVRLGDFTDARRAKAVYAPEFAPDAMFTVNSPNLAINNGGIVSNTTQAQIGTPQPTSVGWYSPTLSGFQLSVTYAPDVSHGSNFDQPTGSLSALDNGGTFRDLWSAAASWSGNLGATTISTAFAVSGATTKKDAVNVISGLPAGTIGGQGNPMVYNAGISATHGPFAVGFGYEQANNLTGFSGTINKTMDAGFTYTIGAITTGAEFSRGSYKNAFGAGTGAPKLNQAIAGASYILGPGVTVSGGVQFNDYDQSGSHDRAVSLGLDAPVGYDSITLLMGTDIKF